MTNMVPSNTTILQLPNSTTYSQTAVSTFTPEPTVPRSPSLPPVRLASYFLWLLPILYMFKRYSISSYSEAPWGLSVLSRVTRIFTGIIISPSLSLRQCPNHYAFRAGRNLPDKEFRYLRTVIVTAAASWGFNSRLRLR